MFTAALLTKAKTWTQPPRPSTEECIKKRWYIHTMKYYSARKKSEIMLLAATWMDLELIILSEVSQRQICAITYMWNLKENDTNELIYQTDSQTLKTNFRLLKGNRWQGR